MPREERFGCCRSPLPARGSARDPHRCPDAGGSGQPPPAALPAMAACGAPAQAQLGHPRAQRGSGAGNQSNAIAGLSVFALGVYGSLGSHQNRVHLPFMSPALFFKSLIAGGGSRAGAGPAVAASIRSGFARPLFIAPLKYRHGNHLLFNAADEKQLCQDFLVILCQ